MPDSPSPVRKILKQPADVVFCRLIGQVSLRIEALGGTADHHLRLINWIHIQKDEYLSQVVLRPGRADGSDRSAHESCDLITKDIQIKFPLPFVTSNISVE